MSTFTLQDLEDIISDRVNGDPAQSYTAKLASKGMNKVAEKFGEEAIEAIVAAVSQDKAALINESADVLFHLLVMLNQKGATINDVLDTLQKRTSQSGLEEKTGRKDQNA